VSERTVKLKGEIRSRTPDDPSPNQKGNGLMGERPMRKPVPEGGRSVAEMRQHQAHLRERAERAESALAAAEARSRRLEEERDDLEQQRDYATTVADERQQALTDQDEADWHADDQLWRALGEPETLTAFIAAAVEQNRTLMIFDPKIALPEPAPGGEDG
jgi:chromosome segregation ATPase